MVNKIRKAFKDLFGNEPMLIRSPGRINLLGEHTDYNQGFVLPAAIDRSIVMALGKRDDTKIKLYACDIGQDYSNDLAELHPTQEGWPDYILGVVSELRQLEYRTAGFNCVFGGDIPIGAGLSSSAALEGAIAFGLNQLLDLSLDTRELAEIGQRAENNFVGVQCGIMDQFINFHGEKDSALRLDCRSLEYSKYPFSTESIKIVLCDTGVRRNLAETEYNVRRQQCENGVNFLRQYDNNITSLRDVSHYFLDKYRAEIDARIYMRCAYVIEENIRVLNACNYLENGDIRRFGLKMFESHEGLQAKYQVSCPELDYLVALSREHRGVLGARMMGAGFGGCTINLVETDYLSDFQKNMAYGYSREFDKKTAIYVCEITDGVSLIDVA